ncbi:hypothetical protein [Musicola paradisiaca]|nr:hypothetical protein [Musicola paradisiaca]
MLLVILIWLLVILLLALVIIGSSLAVLTPDIPVFAAIIMFAALLAPPLCFKMGYWLIGHANRSYFLVKKLRCRPRIPTVALHVNNVRNTRRLRTAPDELECAWNELINHINGIANGKTQILMQSHLFTGSKIRRLKNTFPHMRIHVRQWRMSRWQEGLFRATELCKQWHYPQIRPRGFMLVIRARNGKIISGADTISPVTSSTTYST